MSVLEWFVIVGGVLCALAIASTLIRRLPLSTAMLYLPLGWMLGPHGISAINLHIVHDAGFIEQTTKVIILISLFSAGLKMRVPITSRLWFLSLRLAFLSMVLTVILIAVSCVFLFQLPWGAAILIGGMFAPTDPVLASDVQVENPFQLGALRFGLTSEAGLNDGSAFPFVLLGLMLLTQPFTGGLMWRWFFLDFCWGTVAGIAAGFAVAAVIGGYVLHLRTVYRQAIGLGFFLAPGLIALSYGAGEAIHGYGFLSVFACAVTLRWSEMRQNKEGQPPRLPLIAVDRDSQFEAAVDPETAPLFLVELLLQFTNHLELIGELVIVVIVGALLTPQVFDRQTLLRLPLLFLVIRPIAIFAGLTGTKLGLPERSLMAWFGIRGIGSLFYLTYAVQHALPAARIMPVADTILAAITVSVVIHGISVTPLMSWYSRRQQASAALST